MNVAIMNNPAKNSVREYLSELIGDGESAFTLPSETLSFESLVNSKRKSVNWTCIEYVPEDYQKIKLNSYRAGIPYYNILFGNALDYLYVNKKPFNFVWLDLCTYFTPDVFYRTLKISQNNYNTYAVTFFLKRTKNIEDFKAVYQIKNTEELLEKWIELVEFYSDLRLEKRFDYTTDGYCKMVTVTFKNKNLK
jgi:hypothetical protein